MVAASSSSSCRIANCSSSSRPSAYDAESSSRNASRSANDGRTELTAAV